MTWLMECISCCSMEVKFKKHKLTLSRKFLNFKFFSFPFHEIPVYDSSRGSILCRLWIYLLTARKHIKILKWYEIQKFIPILLFFSHYIIGCTCVFIRCLLQFCICMGHIYFCSNKYSAHAVFSSYWKTFWTYISYDNINVGKTKLNNFLNGWCNSHPWLMKCLIWLKDISRFATY